MSDSYQRGLFDDETIRAVSNGFDPARLTQARLLAGLTKHELADKVGVSPAAVGQYEAGVISPRPDHIEAMAHALEFPTVFFGIGRPYARVDASGAHFRSLRSTRVGQRAKAVSLVEQLWELTYALERRVDFPFVDVPDLGQIERITPEMAADAVREAWAVAPGPLRHLVRTMESRGVVASLLTLGGNDVARVDAFSTSKTPRPLVILTVDRANDIYRHRFTAAHELGHLVLHRDVVPGDVEQEREADRFAAQLLTPAAEIAPELSGRLSVPRLEEVGRHWGVSVDSLVRRSRELGLISEPTARRGYQRLAQLRSAGLLAPQPLELFPHERPALLQDAFALAEKTGLTLGDLAFELAWPIARVRQMLGGEEQRPKLRLV